MQSTFTVDIFFILVYIIPGFVSLLGLYLLFDLSRNENFNKFNMKGNILSILLLSFIAGVIIHSISAFGSSKIIQVNNYFDILDINIVEKNITLFDDHDEIERILENKYRIKKLTPYKTYLYTKTIIEENTANHSASFNRLLTLHTFCLNSIIPILLLFWGINKTSLDIKTKKTKFKFWAVFIIVELTLIYGTAFYQAGAINKALRALIILNS